MRWFQVRLLHRILSTNTFLHKINIKDNNRSSFCNNSPETLTHLFWHCEIVHKFWGDLSGWLQSGCPHIHTLQLTCKSVLFGEIDKMKADETLNFFILVSKTFIYNCRTNKQNLCLQGFKSWMKSLYNTEKYIAYSKCNWNKFNKKWMLYKQLPV